MKIATWNLERLDKRKNQLILERLTEVNADILVLTETNSIIHPENYLCISTEELPREHDGTKYKVGENRTSIWTKYKATTRHKTFDSFTSVCTDIETPFGLLTVYGTIIGVFGNRKERFNSDLQGQLKDFVTLFDGKHICIAGDLNVTFSGYVFPSHQARQTLNDAFKKHKLINTTATIADNVDHIVLSSDFIKNKQTSIETWNTDKKLSDHMGVCLTLTD